MILIAWFGVLHLLQTLHVNRHKERNIVLLRQRLGNMMQKAGLAKSLQFRTVENDNNWVKSLFKKS